MLALPVGGARVYGFAMEERVAALDAVFEPVEPPTTLEETVARLGTAVRIGLLTPGTRLPAERDLAERLCISRSTLRQALTSLAASGHLVAIRGRTGGTFVVDEPPLVRRTAEPLDEEVRALIDHRLAVETGATLLAAERAGPAELELLDEQIERMAAASAFHRYRRADVRFHIGLAEAARSPRLVSAMTEVHGRTSELMARFPASEELLERANEQHRRIAALIGAGDGLGAVAEMRRHIEAAERVLGELSAAPA
jgi:GntR family transcriptional repressor for pyruvate dehydrogenase complex